MADEIVLETKAVDKVEEKKVEELFISINDFAKVDLRVAKILEAFDVPNKDKLLEFKMSLGSLGERTILSGVKQFVAKEEMVGRKVVIVANLAPRPLAGKMSQGMLLTSELGDGKYRPVFIDDDVPEGSKLV